MGPDRDVAAAVVVVVRADELVTPSSGDLVASSAILFTRSRFDFDGTCSAK